MTEHYLQLTRIVERLHRRFLDVMRFELDRMGVEDVNPAQALLLTKIEGRDISVREIVERGYYLGSNAAYNIRQLVQAGYIAQQRSSHDKRAQKVKLTDKGKKLSAKIAEAEKKHAKAFIDDGAGKKDVEKCTDTLLLLESAWSDYLRNADL